MTRIDPLTEQSPAVAESAVEQEVEDHSPGLDAFELARSGGDASGTLVRPDEGEPPFYFG